MICLVGEAECRITSARSVGLTAKIPMEASGGESDLSIESGGEVLFSGKILVGEKVCDGMHIVANPAIDPINGSLIVTKSGSRGHQLPKTLFRIDEFGVSEIEVDILNPTGLGFDENGILYVTNRAEGTVVRIDRDDSSMVVATDLGIATGIAFSPDGTMYVGDRAGTIYKISSLGDARDFATLDSSVSAYHMAFDDKGDLL